ncbi:MAG TPA: hypothetical protein VLJ39_14255 [Tepidisphaeraceae bacterium]|nr:hypothetical protein [Tepidisphaeraceae bacterium]
MTPTTTEATKQVAQDLADKAGHAAAWPIWFKPPEHWPAQTDLIAWCQHMGPGLAALLIALGIVYLLFGFKLFRVLMMLNAAALGAALGFGLGQRTEIGFALMVLCGFVAAAITWPMMKWAVAVLGGIAGALLGASVWQTFGLDPSFAWSGALTGLVLFGLLSFIIFRGSVTMYMSLQGAAMLIFGVLGMVCKYEQIAPKVTHTMAIRPFLLPMAVIIPAIIGMLYQQSDSPAGPPSGKK